MSGLPHQTKDVDIVKCDAFVHTLASGSKMSKAITYAMATFLVMPFSMSWRPHLHTFAYITRQHTSRTVMALRWHWEIWASQVLTTPLKFFGHH